MNGSAWMKAIIVAPQDLLSQVTQSMISVKQEQSLAKVVPVLALVSVMALPKWLIQTSQ
jgi:hypothetical protein